MDAKVASEFWDDEAVLELGPEEKLAALWLLTNSRRKLCGYVEISEKVFAFQTGLQVEALQRAYQGLAKGFVKLGRGVWIRNFIRYQYGSGNRLARNNFTKGLCAELDALGMDDLRLLVAQEYPEIRHLLFSSFASPNEPLAKGLPSPREEKRSTEKSRAEQEEGLGETKSAPIQTELLTSECEIAAKPSEPADSNFEKKGPAADLQKKEGGAASLSLPEQVRRFGAIFGRKVGERWSNMEEVMLSQAQPITDGTLRLIEWRYRQPEEERDPHRQKLATLLQHLPGEIDAARAQFKRHAGDTSTSGTKRQEPEGWREILEKKYRRPEDTEWMAPASFYVLPDSMQAEILKELKQQ